MSTLVKKLDAAIARKGAISKRSFQRLVLDFYVRQGRAFPWRKTTNPYHIAVSEVMLQQTQTERVLEKYSPFIKKFPSWKKLAQASTSEVLTMWQGLGYYRRALNLHRAAKAIVTDYSGVAPKTVDALKKLPGFGAYTAAAVLTFSSNTLHPMIETNIRDLYLYAFFHGQEGVSDREILECVAATAHAKDPRTWFYALMDAGVELKRHRRGTNRRSKHYTRQSAFVGSKRQVRAAVLKLITQKGPLDLAGICHEITFTEERVTEALSALCKDGFLVETARGKFGVM